jgi:hypothetical protein
MLVPCWRVYDPLYLRGVEVVLVGGDHGGTASAALSPCVQSGVCHRRLGRPAGISSDLVLDYWYQL